MNPDWIVAIATTLYVALTGAICFSNFKSYKAAKEQTVELFKQREEAQRPYVQVYIDFVNQALCCLVIQNKGKSSAHNVKATVDAEFLTSLPKEARPYVEKLNESCLFLAPGQKFFVYIGTNRDFESVCLKPIKVSIEYENGKYSDVVEINLSQFEVFISNPPVDERIVQVLKSGFERGSKELNEISKAIKQPIANTLHCKIIEPGEREDNKDKILLYLAKEGSATVIDLIRETGIEKKEILSCLTELQYLDKRIKPLICMGSEGIDDRVPWCLK